MLKHLKIIFAGTSEFSAYFLSKIINESDHKVVLILTKPDQRIGRGKLLQYSAVKKISEKKNIPILQPNLHFTEKDYKIIKSFNTDLLISVSYGLILPERFLSIPKFGCINVHPSLLPRWRGPAPVQRALLAGDQLTGITFIQMNNNVDSGDILYQKSCTISMTDTSKSLYKKLSYIGSKSMLFLLKNISCGKFFLKKKQISKEITYAKKIHKSESRINWNMPAIALERQIRAFNPWPTSFFILKNGTIVKVWSAFEEKNNQFCDAIIPGTILQSSSSGISVFTTEGNLVLTSLQLPNKKIISVSEMLNARKDWFKTGTELQ